MLGSSLVTFEDSGHTVFIAAFVVDKDVSGLTRSTDVTEDIFFTSVDVNKTLTFKKVVVRYTFEA
jgi:hypothetical protein